ncbi:MAG: DUF4440 domain-containing protein [Pseudomonadales bacterium]|nr:DUF4440 domain-containing protein [Pseudomonadales bacterium]
MKNTIFYLVVLVSLFSTTKHALANDIDIIRKASLAHFDAQNRGDAEVRIAHHRPYHTQFSDGGELKVGNSLDEQLESARNLYGTGIKFDLDLTNMNIQIYNDAAVVTGHVVGTVTKPDGEVLIAREQRTAVLIKENSVWKEVHVHISPLTSK